MRDELLSVALHEAGHLLASWWNGQLPDLVELRRHAEGRPRLSSYGQSRGPEVRAFVDTSRFIPAPAVYQECPELLGELPQRYLEDMVARDLLVVLAGPAVEWRLQRDPEHLCPTLAGLLEGEPVTCWGDLGQARELLAVLPARRQGPAYATACRRAAALVCRYWPELHALAEKLMDAERLEGRALHAVLASAFGDVGGPRMQPLDGLDHAGRLGGAEVVAWWEMDEPEVWRLAALVDGLPLTTHLEVAHLDAEAHAEPDLAGLAAGWYCLDHATGEIHIGQPAARGDLRSFFAGLVVGKLEELRRPVAVSQGSSAGRQGVLA